MLPFLSRLTALPLCLFLLVGISAPVAAEDMNPVVRWQEDMLLTGERRDAAISEIEAYLNSLTTMKANFIQIAADGGYARGDFYFSRPDRMRFDFDRSGLDQRDYRRQNWMFLLVSRGQVYFYDYAINTVQRSAVDDELVKFFTQEKIDLRQGVEVRRLALIGGEYVMTLTLSESPHQGALTLFIQADPMQLKGYDVDDGSGNPIKIRFTNAAFDVELPEDRLFLYRIPDPLEYRRR